MDKQAVLKLLKEIGIVPVIRTDAKEDALKIVEAIVEGGIECLEITMTVRGAVNLIAELNKRFQDSVLIGAGTVFDADEARQCQAAGAKFVVTPCLIPEVIRFCNEQKLLICAGALTPTEIFAAHQTGADVVKVFPCSALGGANYLKSLTAPFPHIELMPTGGVTLATIGDFIRAGACAVGVGSDLANLKAIHQNEPEKITALARRYLAALAEARRSI